MPGGTIREKMESGGWSQRGEGAWKAGGGQRVDRKEIEPGGGEGDRIEAEEGGASEEWPLGSKHSLGSQL